MSVLRPWVGCVFGLLLAAPLAAQQVQSLQPRVAPVQTQGLQIDWKAQFEQERAKNQELRRQVDSLQAQLAEWTRKGGSQVHAYCESPTVSRNSAGAVNDCAAGGYTCEPVSGLCRTSAAHTGECAPGRVWCVYGNRCVSSANECQR